MYVVQCKSCIDISVEQTHMCDKCIIYTVLFIIGYNIYIISDSILCDYYLNKGRNRVLYVLYINDESYITLL